MADQTEYRPPTQSQNTKQCSAKKPSACAKAGLAVTATNCCGNWAALQPASCNQRLAEAASVRVSCVVKVLLCTMNKVREASKGAKVVAKLQGSTFDTWCTRTAGAFNSADNWLSASVAMRGPRSEPPMPRFTTSVMAWPLKPCSSPWRKRSAKSVKRVSSCCTSAAMAAPQGGDALWPARKAMCNTGRCSVVLIASPLNMACACSSTWLSLASCNKACITAGVTRWREASA